jgi:hypothetical protein
MEWMADQRRLEMAAEKAAEVVDILGMCVPPIDPRAVATTESKFLRVFGDNFRNSFDGLLEYHGDRNRFLLFFNTKYDLRWTGGGHHPRTRFSLAHELGHYYLDRHRAFLMSGGSPHRSRGEFETSVLMEQEADSFAAGLLMPKGLFRPMVNKGELSVPRIGQLAGLYGASLVSTAIRAVRMSDFPCAVVGVQNGAVAWCFQSEALVKGGCYPRAREPLSSGSALKAWGRFEAGEFTKVSAEGKVADWFETYDRQDLGELPLTEDYMPVPVTRTLVVLLTMSEEDLSGPPED